jgi:hypothetical protein
MCMYLIRFSLQTGIITLALLKDNFGDANTKFLSSVQLLVTLERATI